jgi:tRNA dimethylallyltransferase
MPPRVVVVVGPTASGKSALALAIAEAAGAEVVSADSQQVYRGMDIGTGKLPVGERARVPHHLIDVIDPDEVMSAARFVALADAAIAGAAARGRPTVVAGGTGLYVRALLRGLFEGPAADLELRARLEAEGAPALHERLRAVDPTAAARILPGDLRRLVRALEVHTLTGVPISTHQEAHGIRAAPPRYPSRWVGLDPPRDELAARIDARVDAMFAAGLVDEVRGLAARHPLDRRAFDAIGYREIRAHLAGQLSLDDARAQMKAATRRYARRQRGWFRTEPEVTWYRMRDLPRSIDAMQLGALVSWLKKETD